MNRKIVGQGSYLIYGQSDYVNRIRSYLECICSEVHLHIMEFPLMYEQPDKTEFDFSLHDADLCKLSRDIPVYVGFSMKYHKSAWNKLALLGFHDIRLYDAVLDNVLKKKFWGCYFPKVGRKISFIQDWGPSKEDSGASVAVYRVCSLVDRSRGIDVEDASGCLIPIQAGAALTDQRMTEVLDSTGENISDRNRRYSEMTVFYWMWKNGTADYLGICHYRRLWVNLEGIVEKLRTTDVDVVLPLPTLCEHSVYEDYLLKYIPDVWKPMMEVLKERSPEYAHAAEKIFRERIFYASNMCIVSRAVLDDLCEWMFPIVMEVEQRVGDLQDPYYNRYAGFCTERLMTLYFLYNKQHWKIAHAEKIFLGS